MLDHSDGREIAKVLERRRRHTTASQDRTMRL
jgi:hypothetical protein